LLHLKLSQLCYSISMSSGMLLRKFSYLMCQQHHTSASLNTNRQFLYRELRNEINVTYSTDNQKKILKKNLHRKTLNFFRKKCISRNYVHKSDEEIKNNKQKNNQNKIKPRLLILSESALSFGSKWES
jgi:hypothetical protein